MFCSSVLGSAGIAAPGFSVLGESSSLYVEMTSVLRGDCAPQQTALAAPKCGTMRLA